MTLTLQDLRDDIAFVNGMSIKESPKRPPFYDEGRNTVYALDCSAMQFFTHTKFECLEWRLPLSKRATRRHRHKERA